LCRGLKGRHAADDRFDPNSKKLSVYCFETGQHPSAAPGYGCSRAAKPNLLISNQDKSEGLTDRLRATKDKLVWMHLRHTSEGLIRREREQIPRKSHHTHVDCRLRRLSNHFRGMPGANSSGLQPLMVRSDGAVRPRSLREAQLWRRLCVGPKQAVQASRSR